MRLVGFVICQNGMPDILRCLDSLTCCDEIYICDGGSTDGTLEWLLSVKDVYHIKLLQRPFDTMQNQRNFLLSQLPRDVWVVNIDQDEALNPMTTRFLKKIVQKVTPEMYKTGKQESRVLTFEIPYLVLKNDYEHYCFPFTLLRGKTFFNTDSIQFFHPYHSEPAYAKDKLSQYLAISVPPGFAIFHYAFFNPLYHEKRRERLKKLMENEKENLVAHEYKAWFEMDRDIKPIPDELLPQ